MELAHRASLLLKPEDVAVEQALAAWQRKAAEVLLAAAAMAHFPALLLWALDFGPPMGPWQGAVIVPLYLVTVAAALWRSIDVRLRLKVFLVALYLLVTFLNVTVPRGPYALVGLVMLPVVTLVLVDDEAATFATLASVGVFVIAAVLRGVPAVVQQFEIDPVQTVPLRVAWLQGAVLAAWLIAAMVLLVRFKRFLKTALAAQHRATAALEREVVAHKASEQKLAEEVGERHRLEREIAAVGDAERRRLGQDLHDGVCQQIAAALLHSQALGRTLERGGTLYSADFAPLSSLLAQTIDDARGVARGLCPLDPDPHALEPALRVLAQQIEQSGGVACEFTSSGDVRVDDPSMAQHLYRIAQEALSNALRHASARRLTIGLRGAADVLSLEVEDDGSGMAADPTGAGMGLHTMRYRAHVVGGELLIVSAPGQGTHLTCRIPQPALARAA